MFNLLYRLTTFLFLLVASHQTNAQAWAKLDENRLIESKWRYTYTMHLETNTIIHQAEDSYLHFLYFRYDSTFEQFLNGQLAEGRWTLTGRDLHIPLKQLKSFKISALTDFSLDLEFTQPNSRGTYIYHFIRVENEEAPFLRRANELPEVVIETKALRPKSDLAEGQKKRKRNRRNEPNIVVELVGGGYYGGLDPVMRDYITIKNDGRLIKEFKSENDGLVVVKKNIPREELEQFAEWVYGQKFFDFQRQYDCKSTFCDTRKAAKPRPMPLRLSVTYGNVRKMVTISIWGKDKAGVRYVEYPPELDTIIDAIQRMASRV